jgi:hypothetical protein
MLKKHRNNCKQVFDEQHGTMFSLKDILLERSRLNSSYSTKHGLILTHMYITQKAEDQDNSEEKGNEQKDPRYIIDAGKHTETKRERGASKTNNIAPSTSSSTVGACQEYIEKADLLPP